MTATYFLKTPALQITIPPAFDAEVVMATLADLTAWDGNWPTITDELTLRVALEHARSAKQCERLREITDRTPALHAAFLRLVPEQHWAASINNYDSLTNLFAIIRDLPCKNPHSADLELNAEAELLTDAELAALFPTLLDGKKREVKLRTDAIARRVAALATTDALVVTLWNKAPLQPWRLVRAMSDAQLLHVHAWAMTTERAWRAEKIEYVTTRCRMTWFELLRRGLVTDPMLVDYLSLLETFKYSEPLRHWIWMPRGGDDSLSDMTVQDEILALRDVHVHAATFAPRLQTFVVQHLELLWPCDIKNEEVLLLFAIAWGPELAPALTKMYAGAKDEVKVSHNQSEASRDLADALTGSPHADAMLAVIKKAIDGKRLKDVVEQAVARLANRRMLIPAVGAAGVTEEIQWGRTPTEDALELLLRFKNPAAVIEAGLGSSDPVAVLNAWANAATMYYRHKNQGGPPVLLSESTHLSALASLEKSFGPEQPDGAALQKLIGIYARAAKLFDTGFGAAHAQYASVWTRAEALYTTTKNVRFKEWIEPYLARMDASLVEDVPTKLARLVAETQDDGDTVERHLVLRTTSAPGAKTVNRLFGPPIGVDAKRWPTKGKTKLAHVITIETRLLSETARAALGATVAAVAVFVDSLDKGVEHGVVVTLTNAQLAKNAKAKRGAGSVENGYALEALSAPIPKRVFQGGKKAGPVFELRKLFDRVDLLMPDRSSPSWIQEPQSDGTFLFELDSSFAGELNLGDSGRLFVFEASVFMQCH